MMDMLTSYDIFRARVGDLNDAVIHEIRYDLFSHQGKEPQRLTLTLGVLSISDASNADEWINLVLVFEEVQTFIARQRPKYDFVVLFHVNYGIIDKRVHFNFYGNDSLCNQDALTYENVDLNQPQLLIIANRCYWRQALWQSRGG